MKKFCFSKLNLYGLSAWKTVLKYSFCSVSFITCIFFVFCIFSCKSVPKEETFHPATSLEDLTGIWKSENGEYEYPFVIGNKKYIRIATASTDDTELWNEYSALHGINFEDLWKKRFSYLQYVYVPDGYVDRIPISDSHGTEYGRKLEIRDGRIFSRLEMLVPEKILVTNLRFFMLNKNESVFKEDGVFHLASDVFTDLTSDGTVFVKKIMD